MRIVSFLESIPKMIDIDQLVQKVRLINSEVRDIHDAMIEAIQSLDLTNSVVMNRQEVARRIDCTSR
jgi:hypothetical protein